jgi:hypothetical protein
MNNRVDFVIDKLRENAVENAKSCAILSLIVVPLSGLIVFGIRKDLVTLALTTAVLYYVLLVLWYSYQAKRKVK